MAETSYSYEVKTGQALFKK